MQQVQHTQTLYMCNRPKVLHKKTTIIKGNGKGKGEVHPRTGHEGPEGE
jgi:hypothetical protein